MNNEQSKVEVYSNGMVHCSVCVHKSLNREEIEKAVNLLNPSGTQNGWKISEKAFADGSPNPCACDQGGENRLHYLMVC